MARREPEERKREYDFQLKTKGIKPLPDSPWKWPVIWIMLVLAIGATWALVRIITVLDGRPVVGTVIGIAFGSVLIGYPLTQILMEGALMGWRWLNWMPYAGWHGTWYEFDGHHLRFEEVDGELWFVDRDVLAVIGLRRNSALLQLLSADERTALEGSYHYVLSPRGVERLLLKSPHPMAKKLLIWFQREVFEPHRRKVDRVQQTLRSPTPPAAPDVIGVPPALQPRGQREERQE